jgi:hypothetical protein
MPRRLIAGLATILVVVLVASNAAAGAPPGCGRTFLGGGIVCRGGTTSGSGGTPGHPSPPGGSTTGSGSPKDVLDVAEASAQRGKNCYLLVAVDIAGMSQTQIGALEAASVAVEVVLPACPIQPVAPGGAAPVPVATPPQLAQRFWDTIRLPVPHPESQPDYAVTGKVTYLRMGDTNTPGPWTKPTPYGTLTITAQGTYTVDWGDSTPPSGPYTTTGASYPTGTITHTYDNVGTVTITATERWTATWTIGTAFHGTLDALHTTGTIADFAIRQVQAVITGA